jgi:2'-5' RNA ligase
VLWAGISPVQEISALAAQIDRSVVACGVASEDRDFSPHLTLARIRDPKSAAFVKSFLAEHQTLASEAFAVDRFHLYQSELSPKGARHTVLESFALA